MAATSPSGVGTRTRWGSKRENAMVGDTFL
jgi:hypothetical protein